MTEDEAKIIIDSYAALSERACAVVTARNPYTQPPAEYACLDIEAGIVYLSWRDEGDDYDTGTTVDDAQEKFSADLLFMDDDRFAAWVEAHKRQREAEERERLQRSKEEEEQRERAQFERLREKFAR